MLTNEDLGEWTVASPRFFACGLRMTPYTLDLRQIDGERERLGGLPHIRRALDRADHRHAVHPGPDHRTGVRDVDAADAD